MYSRGGLVATQTHDLPWGRDRLRCRPTALAAGPGWSAVNATRRHTYSVVDLRPPRWWRIRDEKRMEVALVVQKYGGSSGADADRIRRVAARIVEAKKQGNDVVVVVSAMGDTTDNLLDLAQQVCPAPPARPARPRSSTSPRPGCRRPSTRVGSCWSPDSRESARTPGTSPRWAAAA